MTQEEILTRLRPLIAEVTGVEPGAIHLRDALVRDLGAESLDLLDLSFLIEEKFGVEIEPNEFERGVTERIPGGVYELEGRLTPEALTELTRVLPEIDPRHFVPGLRKADLPSLLTVEVFVHLIERKQQAKEMVAHA